MLIILLVLLILLLGGGGGYVGYRRNYYGAPAGGLIGLLVILLVAWLILPAHAAETTVTAEGATSASTTITLLPLYIQMIPYIAAGVGGIVMALCGWLATKITGKQLDDSARAAIAGAVGRAAGRVLAGQEGNVAALKFDVGSPLIATEATKVQALVGDALKRFDLTPEAVAGMITGEIGKLQASVPVAPVVVAPATPVSVSGAPIGRGL